MQVNIRIIVVLKPAAVINNATTTSARKPHKPKWKVKFTQLLLSVEVYSIWPDDTPVSV